MRFFGKRPSFRLHCQTKSIELHIQARLIFSTLAWQIRIGRVPRRYFHLVWVCSGSFNIRSGTLRLHTKSAAENLREHVCCMGGKRQRSDHLRMGRRLYHPKFCCCTRHVVPVRRPALLPCRASGPDGAFEHLNRFFRRGGECRELRFQSGQFFGKRQALILKTVLLFLCIL